MSGSGMRDIEALERELSWLPPYRAPEALRRSLRARLISEATPRMRPPGWLGFALGRAAALAVTMVLLLSGVAWAVVASAPGDPLFVVKDAITRLIGTPGSEVRPVPTREEAPATMPTAVPADTLAPPSIAPSEASESESADRGATEQPASRPPEPTTQPERATAVPSSPPRATPAVPPSPPGPRATPAVPPPQP